ncbi:Site-specific recombinase XerD [Microlunatus flavus]|uniref:Site-specific recombinase XerD n=1 Tax=Microlunatus flavus TaxID=1036181 RepID=A0A1H9L9Q0_9ACTN|nr:Site-specific recombinase XerD [Microlunatus flavus]
MTARRLFGSLRQRESGRWQIRYRTKDGGRVAWPETYARRADAARVLAELERQAQVGGKWLDGSKVLFGTYAEEWLLDNPRLRPRTADVYRSLYRRHLAPRLAGVPLGQLDTAVVRQWRSAALKGGTSSTMVAKAYRLLRAILNSAMTEDELITVNPCRIRGAGEERSPERPVLSLEQLEALAGLVPDRWRAFVLLKTFASLRWGEITALTRADLDLEQRTVRVRRQFLQVPGGLQVGPPKSRAGLRTVSFPAAILPELRRHLDAYSSPGADGLIFPTEHGQPWRRSNFNTAARWREACAEVGVPQLHLHDLRHTGNTFAAQSGASLRDLMARMGHDSPAAALIYQHSSQVADRAIAEALDRRVETHRRRVQDRSQRSDSPKADAALGPVGGPRRREDTDLGPKKDLETALTRADGLERTTGIEPAYSAWEADVLPLNYVRRPPVRA